MWYVRVYVHKSQFLSSNLRSNSTVLTNSKLKQFFVPLRICDISDVRSSPNLPSREKRT